MNTFAKLFKLFTVKERYKCAGVLLVVLGMALLDTAGVASLMPFLAVVGDPEMINTHPVLRDIYIVSQDLGVSNPGEFLIVLGIGSFALLIISAIYRTWTQFKMNSFIETMRHSISSRILSRYLSQPYEFFMGRNTADLSKTALSEVDQLIGGVIRPVFSMLAYSIIAVFMILLLLYLYPLLLVISAILLGGTYFLIFAVVKPILDRLGKLRTSANKNRFLVALEALNGIRDLKLLGYEKNYLVRYDSNSIDLSHTLATNLTLNRVPKYIIEAVAFGGIIAMIVSLMVSDGGIEGETLGKILPRVGVFAFAAYRLQPALHFVFSGLASLRFGKTAIAKIYEDLFEVGVNSELKEADPDSLGLKQQLEVRNLSFKYLGTEKLALKDISFTLSAGGVMGIVGTTGCGKSTLVNLLLNLLTPSGGSLIVDGKQITPDIIQSWQRTIGCVSQDIFLTDNTLAENIAFGVESSEIDLEQVQYCAKLASIHEFIVNNLEIKYETLVGERGVRLSGGQRQRVGIARALYHNPDLLIFDEATSSLDSVVEKAIMEAIDTLSNDKTIIIVAHRMNTIKKCDNILLLNEGMVEASGTYDELSQSSKRFQEMVKA
jgi:ABC-type multidrug transport system fused ATPase/permease subunit